jgi:hypothetical protein
VASPEVLAELRRIRSLTAPPARLGVRVLDTLRAGELSAAALAERLGVRHQRLSDVLGGLVQRGRLARVERGPGLAPVYRAR